jgi:hypothetical protein
MSNAISAGQMKRLQVLYGHLARHTQQGADRDARMAWAAELLQRPIDSFKDLTQQEATMLIDTLQGQLGIKTPAKKRRLDRDAAHRAGTEGRRGSSSNSATLASAEDWARIRYALGILGWSQEQLDAWLRSPKSPLGKRSSPAIRTLGDANRVWWALKNMAKSRGLWKEVA